MVFEGKTQSLNEKWKSNIVVNKGGLREWSYESQDISWRNEGGRRNIWGESHIKKNTIDYADSFINVMGFQMSSLHGIIVNTTEPKTCNLF